jgi:hypothetical protein
MPGRLNSLQTVRAKSNERNSTTCSKPKRLVMGKHKLMSMKGHRDDTRISTRPKSNHIFSSHDVNYDFYLFQ